MENKYAIGVDVGGSHISSAVVDLSENQLISKTFFERDVDNKQPKENIFKQWATVMNKSILAFSQTKIPIGMAIPGPFNYKSGMAYYEVNGKYEALYHVNVGQEFPNYLEPHQQLRFMNDASAFGIGAGLLSKADKTENLVAITLGTGFGVSFISNQLPVTEGDTVPENGCLWDKPFKNSIADDYISTRWFVNEYKKESGIEVPGVKEVAEANNPSAHIVFDRFSQNLATLLLPHLKRFNADRLIIGGNITKAHELFMPQLKTYWREQEFSIPVSLIERTDEAVILGSAQLSKADYWNRIRHLLPSI